MATLGRRAFLAALAFVSPLARMVGVAQTFSLDDFLKLSSRLTGQTNLDRAAADTFLKGFIASGHAATLARPDPALEREIIVAWYTGAQKARDDTRLVTHTSALKWRAMGLPAPGACAGRFGVWSQPSRPANR